MDYTIQVENIFKYLSLALDEVCFFALNKIKKDFNNDLNLFGCYIKDFLTIRNSGEVCEDENIYNEFILCFEKYARNPDEFLIMLKRYASYYLSLVFETIENNDILGYITSINLCYAIDTYPFIMKIFDEYYTRKINFNVLNSLLKSVVDIVVERENDVNLYNINLFEALKYERLAG